MIDNELTFTDWDVGCAVGKTVVGRKLAAPLAVEDSKPLSDARVASGCMVVIPVLDREGGSWV